MTATPRVWVKYYDISWDKFVQREVPADVAERVTEYAVSISQQPFEGVPVIPPLSLEEPILPALGRA